MGQECRFCRFWRPAREVDEFDAHMFSDLSAGVCRRSAPPWPETYLDDTCGEFEPGQEYSDSVFEPSEAHWEGPAMSSFEIPPLAAPTRRSCSRKRYSWVIVVSLTGIVIWICTRAPGYWLVAVVILAIVVGICILSVRR